MSAEDAALGPASLSSPSPQGDGSLPLFLQIADRSPSVVIVAAGSDFRIVYANSAAHQAAQRGACSLVGRSAAEALAFVDPALLATKTEAKAWCVADGIADRATWWDVSYVALDSWGTMTKAVLVTAFDVTHHEIAKAEAQAAVRDREQRLWAVLLQIPAATFIVEAPDGRTTFKSRLVDEVLGDLDADLERGRATLRGWAVHADGSPYDVMEYPSRRALFTGETVRAEPMAFQRADGRLIDLEMYAGPIYNEAGEVVAAAGVALDVTERRLAEARQAFLFHLQDRLRALSSPAEILSTAATLIGRHLGAARISYCELQPDGETLLVTSSYVNDAPQLNGLFPLSRLGPHYEQQMRMGLTAVYDDVQADELGAKAVGLEFGTRAHVSAPLIRGGRYTGSLNVTHFQPKIWSPADITLIEEVAARVWDAAERGRAEAQLRQSEERLRLALESSGLGSWEYDAINRKIVHSARHDAILGYSEPVHYWSQERAFEHIIGSDRGRVAAEFRAALERGEEWDAEIQIIRADGGHGWVNVRAKPQCGADGKVVRVFGTVADITERKRAEAAVIQTAAKFETFAQTVPSMVWTCLPNGQADWFNARVSEFSGLSAAEMISNGWDPLHPDDVDRAGKLWRDALASGEPYETECRLRRHDGVYRWHLSRALPIRGPDGAITLWVGGSTDIDDQKSSAQALADLNATLEEQVRERTAELMAAEESLRQSQKMEAVGQLTGGLAHDFNNLLTGITGSLEMLATRVGAGRFNELDRYLHIAQGAAQRAAALTHRLLAFSRRQTLDPKPTDINQLVHGMDDLIRRTVGPAVSVKFVGARGVWPVLADPNQLENALLNLCINARDAMPDGGALIIETRNRLLEEQEAKARELPAAAYVTLSVSDTGCGMPSDILARAFDPFFTTKPIGEGTGLGLSMVYGFARQSGGRAGIVSQPGRGTTVSLDLPRYIGEFKPAEQVATQQRPERGDGRTVLVVDDEASVRLLIKDVLSELGYSVLEAENGASGLRLLESIGRIDLLVTDVGLPGGMNGRQLADAALVNRPALKVLFITGYAENAVIGGGHLKSGMHILTKPFSLETLGGRVREIISGA